MNLKVEHGIIAILLLAFLYYFFTHQSLLSDLSSVPDNGNPELKAVKGKHAFKKVVVIGKNGFPLDRRTCIENCVDVYDNRYFCTYEFDECPPL